MSKIGSKIKAAFKPVPYVPQQSLTELLASTEAQAAAALSFFEASAADLAEAALKQDAIAGLLYDEIEAYEIESAKRLATLDAQAAAAVSASITNIAAATRIRELVGSL